MTDQTVIDLGSRAVWVAIEVSAPVLVTALVTGVLISIIQAATQINEQTLSFVPKRSSKVSRPPDPDIANARDQSAGLIGQPCVRGRTSILELALRVSECARTAPLTRMCETDGH